MCLAAPRDFGWSSKSKLATRVFFVTIALRQGRKWNLQIAWGDFTNLTTQSKGYPNWDAKYLLDEVNKRRTKSGSIEARNAKGDFKIVEWGVLLSYDSQEKVGELSERIAEHLFEWLATQKR